MVMLARKHTYTHTHTHVSNIFLYNSEHSQKHINAHINMDVHRNSKTKHQFLLMKSPQNSMLDY